MRYARLNITWNGQNGDLPDPVSWHASDKEILRWAAEAVRSGSVPGITALTFDHFRAAHDEFSDGLTRGRKIQILLDYCLRHNQVEPLLQQLERLNPTQFRQHQSQLKYKS